MSVLNQQDQEFLRDDLYDALRWLGEGAIVWEAARQKPRCAGRHQEVLGMYTRFVQARALYEFFYAKGKNDDARAESFAPSWKPRKSSLYERYIGQGTPAQKRVFHLVRRRSMHAGGTGKNTLNKQILAFAKDLLGLMEDFHKNAAPVFRDEIEFALMKARKEADSAAKHYGIPNPL